MNNEEMLKKIGTALIAAGYALAGPDKKAVAQVEAEAKQTEETKEVEAKTEDTPKTTKKKRKRKTKAQVEAEKKAEAEEHFDAEVVEPDEVVQEVALDQDKLKAALVSYAKKTSKDQAFGILAKFGAKKVADLDPKHYQAVYEKVAVNA